MGKRTRFEVPCLPGELECWRLAAGDVPLARWARRVLNEVAVVVEAERRAAAGPLVSGLVDSRVPPSGVLPPVFRPDFKGGKR